jgi:hypothetical protein
MVMKHAKQMMEIEDLMAAAVKEQEDLLVALRDSKERMEKLVQEWVKLRRSSLSSISSAPAEKSSPGN